jgi:hypothetical protein
MLGRVPSSGIAAMFDANTVLTKMRQLVADFGDDRRGNIVITFALAIIPLIGAVGAAVDSAAVTPPKPHCRWRSMPRA